MGKSVNKTILLGNVGKDPEIRSTDGGTLVANLSLATADRFKDKQGEWQERTEWHNLVAYARGAEIIRDYVKKGSKLYVEGKIRTRSWDDKESGKESLPDGNRGRRHQPSFKQRWKRQAGRGQTEGLA